MDKMSWMSSVLGFFGKKPVTEIEMERELTPTKYRVFDTEFTVSESPDSGTEEGTTADDSSEDDSWESGKIDLCYARSAADLLCEPEILEHHLPEPQKAKELIEEQESEGIATSESPAPIYTTLVRPSTPPTPPTPDWPGASPPPYSAGLLVKYKLNNKVEWDGAKKIWGSVRHLAGPAATTLKKKFTSQQKLYHQGQSGFEDFRRYIKQGGDFCKELAVILHERSEAEAQYSKSLAKLSTKLIKATKESTGSVNTAWHRIGLEMESESDLHRTFATSLCEEVVKPLRAMIESQHRIRKSVETSIDKSGKTLAEWRAAEAKAKKNSFTCARDNEKLRDNGEPRSRLSTSSLHISKVNSDKDSAKMENKRRKAEECMKKADVEYYTMCLRAERSRLEWATGIVRGSHCFEVLEEERLKGLNGLAKSYVDSFQNVGPKITQLCERIAEPVDLCDISKDLETVNGLKLATEPSQEQLLPDFYPEHTTLAMNRDRRKQALVKLLQLIRGDLERERRGKAGVENLVRAFKQTPNFTSEDSQQNVEDKLHHMRSMLTYLEAARYKIQSALAEIEGGPTPSHPLASHIQVSRDRQGYQQSILKVPNWVHESSVESSECSDWVDRGCADGTSVQPDSDFDEFSSQGSDKEFEAQVIIPPKEEDSCPQKCRALYNYSANLYDELNLTPGDVINIHDKQPDGWWLGELNGVVGIFPATYVEEI